MRKVFSKALLASVRPEIMAEGDGVIDVHVDTEAVPAGRYKVVEMHDGCVIAELAIAKFSPKDD